MHNFFKRLFDSKKPGQVREETIEQFMQQIGIDPKTEQFRTEAYHLSTLIIQQKLTAAQALETVKDNSLREELRPFIYAVFLSAVVGGAHHLGAITSEQAQDLTAYLGKPWNI